MSKLPVISGSECIKRLKKMGFDVCRQKGSHVILKNAAGTRTVVPLHKKLDRGTLRTIINQSGLSLEKFKNL